MHSVLAKASVAELRLDPFPYLVIEHCLPEDYYRALADAYPSDELILELNAWRRKARQQNQRHDIAAARALQQAARLPPIWMDFIRYHSSQAFYAETLRLFGDAIRTCYPQLERRLGRRLEACNAGVRFDRERDKGQVSLDCQVGINTPVQHRSSVRRVHADAVEELYAMLLYFRRDEDDASGGDLEIYRWKDGVQHRFRGQEVDEEDAEYVTTVPYRANTLVAFVNSENSLHAVSARAVTPHSRRLVNLLGEVYRSVPRGLFIKRQKDAPPDLWSRLGRTLGLGV